MPCLELRRETLLVEDAGRFAPVEAAVIALSFDYAGVRVPAADPGAHVFVAGRGPSRAIARDRAAEGEVRRILESHGPVDLTCIEDCAPTPGSGADYAVDVEGDPDALCTFSARAVPALRELGWEITVAQDYPCQLVDTASWYARALDGDDRDWFELELGVEVDGQRVDLLPVLLDLVRRPARLQLLLRSPGRLAAIPVGDGRVVAVSPQRLSAIASVIAELHQLEGAPSGRVLKIPRLVPYYFERFEHAGASALRWLDDGSARRRAQALAHGEHPPAEPPPGLQATLRPYQRDGLSWLQALGAAGTGGVLADDMGLGKTLQTIAHLLVQREAGAGQALVVAPKSVVTNWARELQRFAPSLAVAPYHGPGRQERRRTLDGADVVLTTYPTLMRDADALTSRRFDLLVLDEAQVVKNASSQTHRVCRDLDAGRVLALTGTPVENNLEELWSIVSLAVPGLLGRLVDFRTLFRQPIEEHGDQDRLAALRARIAPFVLRRRKDRVAGELPPKTEVVHTVELQGTQRDLYESIRLAAHADVRKALRDKGLAGSTIDILGALMKLRQVCCDPRLVPIAAARDVEASAKFDALFELLEPLVAEGRQMLVFSQFTSMLALIAEALRHREIPYESLTGATAHRQRVVDRFQRGDSPVFLVSLKAGGTGLNLTAADTVIHYDPWWNPAAQAQATDRAYRLGQTRPVFAYNLIAAGSVEERILGLQGRKRQLADGVLEGGAPTELTQADVDGLFAPLRDS